MIATVKYQVATYKGTISVTCAENDDDDLILAKAKGNLTRNSGTLPFGYESWKVVSRE